MPIALGLSERRRSESKGESEGGESSSETENVHELVGSVLCEDHIITKDSPGLWGTYILGYNLPTHPRINVQQPGGAFTGSETLVDKFY